MLTNNLKKILFKHIFGFKVVETSSTPPDANDAYSDHPTLISISGSNCPISIGSGSSAYVLRRVWITTVNALSTLATTPTNGLGYIVLGNGTTEPTPEDYRLESQITTNLSCDSVSVSRNTTIKTYTATFSNSGTSPMTITEIGYVSRIIYTYTYFNFVYDDFLMDRTVLETPITIPAGESRTVTYELSF
jgi:hypothetical protein